MSEPEFLSSIQAKMALETPQILCSWGFGDVVSPIYDIEWLWDTMVIRRSEYRYPEDVSDGDNILSEAYSVDPTTALSDISIDDMKYYYYSMFLQYQNHTTNEVDRTITGINRIGSELSGMHIHDNPSVLSATDGATSAGSPIFISAGSTFLTDGIIPGFLFQIDEGGADDGFYEIISVDSEIQVTLDTNLILNAANVDFYIFSDHVKVWVCGNGFNRKQAIWKYDTKTNMVDEKIDLSIILNPDETIIDISYVGDIGGTRYISFITNTRYIIIPCDLSAPTNDDIVNQWEFVNLSPNFNAVGAQYDSAFLYILDSVNLEIKKLSAADGSASATYDISGLEEVDTRELGGLYINIITSEILFGCRNFVYVFDIAALTPDSSDITKVIYTKRILMSGFCMHVNPLTAEELIYTIDLDDDVLESYRVLDYTIPGVWQQPSVPDENTIALYHLDETVGNPQDSSAYANNGVNNGMTIDIPGRFNRSFEAITNVDNIDIVAISGEFNENNGTIDFWVKVSDITEMTDTGTDAYFISIVVDSNNFICIMRSSGQLRFAYVAGGVVVEIIDVWPYIDTNWHRYTMTWNVALDEIKSFVDNTQFGITQNGLGVWVGAVTAAYVGGSIGVPIAPFIVDANTVTLWHFDEGVGILSADAGPNMYNLTLGGAPPPGWVPGVFGSPAVNYNGINNSSNIIAWPVPALLPPAIAGAITIEAWVNPAIGVPAWDYVIWDAQFMQYFYLQLGTGKLGFSLRINGVFPINVLSNNVVTPGVWSHVAGTFDGTTLRVYINGILEGETVNPGVITLTGAPTPKIGSFGGGMGGWFTGDIDEVRISDIAREYTVYGIKGIYDEVHLSDVTRGIVANTQSYTKANKMHAFSGRDYTKDYGEGNPLNFYYRDQIFTPKFMGGEFRIRNDYEKSKLHPPNKVMDNKEVLFRGPDPLPSLGDKGRLARLFGLYLDRIADQREALKYIHNVELIDIDDIQLVADSKGYLGLDVDNWNVDKQRRYLRIMPWIMKRGGRLVSYIDYARFLGFIAEAYTLHARRRWDSVHYNANFDPSVQAIYLDEMGSMDTADENFPLALLRWRFYYLSNKSALGVTSIPANRLLTDASATFSTTAEIGSLIHIYDKDDIEDNDTYIVTEIHSNTELKVDKDWPVGSLINLTYTVNWEVPQPDPHIDYLLTRFSDISPVAMRLMHRDEEV